MTKNDDEVKKACEEIGEQKSVNGAQVGRTITIVVQEHPERSDGKPKESSGSPDAETKHKGEGAAMISATGDRCFDVGIVASLVSFHHQIEFCWIEGETLGLEQILRHFRQEIAPHLQAPFRSRVGVILGHGVHLDGQY